MWKRLKYVGRKGQEYSISSDGRIWMRKKGKFLTQRKNGKYKTVCINAKPYAVHRLVAEAFYPHCYDAKKVVHHIDCNPDNNHIDNLMWLTDNEHRAFHNKWQSQQYFRF